MKDIFGIIDRLEMKFGKGFTATMQIHGNLDIKLFGPDGKIKDRRQVHNTVTNAGKYGAADQILETPTLAKAGWMELGTGAGGTTKLNAYIAGSRNALTSKTRNNAVVTMVGDWAAGDGTGPITEAGLFDVVTENTVNMWLYSSFDVINKGDLDALQITWTLTYL
jgi:hypothetical protein